MLKMVNKTLVLCVVGALFPAYTQGMDDDSYKQRGKYEDNCGAVVFSKQAGMFDAGSSACFRTTGGPESPLPKSDVMPQISYEYLLYEFCNHQLDDEGSKAKEDSRKNKEYYKKSLTTPAYRAFSVQPNSDLKNQIGHEIEEWLVRRDKEYTAYKAASTELQKREGLQQKSPSQRNEIRFRIAEQKYNAILNHFVRMHGPTEVMLGEREATEKEIASIKQIIYSKKKPSIITGPRAFYSSGLAVGTPYFESPDVSKVQGFILEPRELPRAYERLRKRVEALTREQEILKEISVYYHEEFLTKVKGWSAWQLANWMDLPQIVATAQIDVKGLIEKKYPLPPFHGKYARDRTTDQGEVLAYINRDERGQQIRVRLSKVDRSFVECSHQDQKMSQADHFFARIYHGEDELEPNRTPEGCHIDTKYPHPDPVTVQFEKVKTRKYILDEEKYRILLMYEPLQDDFNLLGSNEIGIFLKDNQLYCWVKDKGEMRIDTLPADQVNDISEVVQKDVYERLQKAVQENTGVAPEDRREFLDFILLKKHIFRTQNTWVIPKDKEGNETYKMADSYPAISHVLAHKRKWVKVAEELKKKHNPIITDSCREPSELTNGCNVIRSYEDLYYDPGLLSLSQPTYLLQELTDYNLLYKDYELLLGGHIKLLQEMHQPFGSYTYVPEAIKFFISEAYAEKPSILPVIPPQEIILKDASIRDDDLQKKRLAQSGCEYMLYCYLNVDLSHNFLTGSANYHFSQFITTLNLSNNHITSLKFLAGLSALKILDLSYNMLSDLSNFSRSGEQGSLSLQELNLADNEIEDITPLSALKILKKLDVSGNKLKSLRGLYKADAIMSCDIELVDGKAQVVQKRRPMNMSLLTSLKVNNNALKGRWDVVFPVGLKSLTTLEIKGNTDLVIPVKPHDFFEIFPALKTLKTDAGDEDNMSKEPALIDFRYRFLEDENIEIKDRLLTTGGEGENIIEEAHTLFYCMWLNLSNNKLVGLGLRKNGFSSDCIVKLEMSKNKLCSLDFIRGFPNLTYFDASSNHIDELSPLEACSTLRYLDISHNSVRNLQDLNGFKSLEILKASSNAFEGHWKNILPKGLINLETIEVGNNNALIFTGWGQLRTFFPALKFLNRGESAFVRDNKEEAFKEVSYG